MTELNLEPWWLCWAFGIPLVLSFLYLNHRAIIHECKLSLLLMMALSYGGYVSAGSIREAALPSYEMVEVVPESLNLRNGEVTATAVFEDRSVNIHFYNSPVMSVDFRNPSPIKVRRYFNGNKERFVMEK
jgi:hypothetical protein